MTLVLSASLSGQVAFMTSDTRVVQANYKPGTAEVDLSVPMIICDEKYIKTHKLNDRVLLGAGGTADLSVYLTEVLKREVNPEHDLADCKEILEHVIKRERSNETGPEFLSFLNLDEGVSIMMNGFYRDGSTGLVSFSAGKDSAVTETKSPYNTYLYGVIAPAKEFLRRTDELFNIPKLNENSTFEGLSPEESGKVVFQTLFDHLIMLHGVASYNHPVEISPDFEVHVITLENGEHCYSKSNFDLSETHKLYDELKKQIDASA